MAKPIVKTIHAFDAHTLYTVEFTWSGNQAYNNRMVIYDASSQAVIYDHTYSQNFYRLAHDIPAYTLDNNKQYAVQISVIDANGTSSPFSDKYYFWTAATPDFHFSNLVDGQTIYAASITLDLVYEQNGTETLVWTKFFLYDAAKIKIAETETDYTASLTHTFTALDNNIQYYARATATTEHGMSLDTGYVGFVPSYQNPATYARIYAEPDEETGFVNYYSNIIVISPDKDDYEYDHGFIDLTVVDDTATMNIYTTSTPNASMDIYWKSLQNEVITTVVEDGNAGTTITDYKYIEDITIKGNTTQDAAPEFLKDNHDISSIQNCMLTINRVPVEDITYGLMLNKLPISGCDSLLVKHDGTRLYTKNVGYHIFTSYDEAVRTENVNNEFITYYDFGGLANGSPRNVMCSCIPVCNDSTTSISVDPTTGWIKIIWRSDSNVISESGAQRFFRNNSVVVLFPLYKSIKVRLSPVSPMPYMINLNVLRYSRALTIPGRAATWGFRMKSCRRNAHILKLYCGDKIDFLLSSRIYEDNTVRFKLTVYGDGPTYTQYSNVLDIDVDDIVTVFIRRIDGIYGLFVTTIESSDTEYENIWLGIPKPEYAEERDLWIDLTREMVRILKEDVTCLYQAEEPTDVGENSIWIGGALT